MRIFILLFLWHLSVFAQTSQSKEVIVEGVGKDVSEASQNAARNALTNVVGSFIDAKTFLEKRVQIQNGITNQTKNIKTDIKEYSQGVIQKFEILKVEDNKFITVTAKVVIGLEELKVYVKDFSENAVKVNEGLFAQVATEAQQSKNAASFVYENILLPLVNGDGLDVLLSAPISASQLVTPSPVLWRNYFRSDSDLNFIAFYVEVRPKVGFWDSAKKVLNSISKSKIDIGNAIGNGDNGYGSYLSYRQLYPKSFEPSVDFTLALYETDPKSKLKNTKTASVFTISNAKNNFAKLSPWTRYFMYGDGYGNWKGRSEFFSSDHPTPYQPLQVEIVDAVGKVLMREIIDSNTARSPAVASRSGRLLAVASSEFSYSSPWSLVGGQFNAGSGEIWINDSKKFSLIIALDDNILKNSKSVNVKILE